MCMAVRGAPADEVAATGALAEADVASDAEDVAFVVDDVDMSLVE